MPPVSHHARTHARTHGRKEGRKERRTLNLLSFFLLPFGFHRLFPCVRRARHRSPPQVWLPAACGKDTILKIREREGGRRPKPLWTDVMELAGDDYADIASDLYEQR